MGEIHGPHWRWRVSKYDPSLRNAAGVYQGDEWTFAAQVGAVVNGQRLTLEEYLAVEDRYVAVAGRFIAEAGLTTLRVEHLENHFTTTQLKQAQRGLAHPFDGGVRIREGEPLTGLTIERAIRLNLREFLGCDLCEPDRFCLSFGWDYYMYIASISPCPASIRYARELGLFVDEMQAPPLGV